MMMSGFQTVRVEDPGVPRLMTAPDLWEQIVTALRTRVAGDSRAAQLCYIAMTSRLLPRPLSVALVGASGSGKTSAINSAKSIVPRDSYYEFSAVSPMALVYDPASYRNKMVIVGDGDSLPQEGPAAAMFRAMVDQAYMAYLTVQPSKKTGELAACRIEKEGPTGVITTATRAPGEQLGNRILPFHVDAGPDRIRHIITDQARVAAGCIGSASVTHEELVAVQEWLESAGVRRVIVPFARELGAWLCASGSGSARHFAALITAISAVALLHQLQRQLDGAGTVIAGLQDYGIVEDVFGETFADLAAGGVTRQVQATVAAVRRARTSTPRGAEVTYADVARVLQVSRPVAVRMVQEASELGLVYNASRPGQKPNLFVGEELPPRLPGLPTVDELDRAIRAGVPAQPSVFAMPVAPSRLGG